MKKSTNILLTPLGNWMQSFSKHRNWHIMQNSKTAISTTSGEFLLNKTFRTKFKFKPTTNINNKDNMQPCTDQIQSHTGNLLIRKPTWDIITCEHTHIEHFNLEEFAQREKWRKALLPVIHCMTTNALDKFTSAKIIYLVSDGGLNTERSTYA